MRDGRIGSDSLDAGRRVALDAARLDEVRDGRIALASVSAGASIALLIAAHENVEPHVSVVAGIAPYARARTAVEVATIGGVELDDGSFERFDSTAWMQTAIARSLFQATSDPPAAERLEARALEQARPIDFVQQLPASALEGATTPVLDLLRSGDAEEFDERFAALPDTVRAELDALSPLGVVSGVDAPIRLASAPDDKYFPLGESRAIVAAAPDATLTVTSTLEHAIPDASLDELAGLAAFDSYLVRVLRAAADA